MNNKGIKTEKKLAEKVAGKTVARSGGGILKGDVKTKEYLIQSKYTDKKSFSLKLTDLEKAEEEAIMENRMPLFYISFGGKEYWIINNSMANELIFNRGDALVDLEST